MELKTEVKPLKYTELSVSDRNDWCPGCGDNGIRTSLSKAIVELTNDPTYTKTVANFIDNNGGVSLNIVATEEGEAEDIALKSGMDKSDVEAGLRTSDVLMVSGIGCFAKITNQMTKLYTFHSLHGRAIAVAQAAKLANWDLEVIVNVGDGDGLGIGGNHFFHGGRKNIDMTIMIHDNQVYGLTKGQMSPTMLKHMKTKSMAAPSTKEGINPLAVSISSHYTFIGQSYSNSVKHLSAMIKDAMKHNGTSIINILQTCPTYNDIFTDKFFKQRLHDISELNATYDPVVRDAADRSKKQAEAFAMAQEGYMRINPEDGERESFTGIYYQDLTTLPLEAVWADKIGPIALAKRDITDPARKENVRRLMKRYQKI